MVAGTNYKLLLDIANSANKMEHVEATVYGVSQVYLMQIFIVLCTDTSLPIPHGHVRISLEHNLTHTWIALLLAFLQSHCKYDVCHLLDFSLKHSPVSSTI